jgi:hypothetical protein
MRPQQNQKMTLPNLPYYYYYYYYYYLADTVYIHTHIVIYS